MNKQVESARDPAMLDDYDFSQGVRGKYVERFTQGSDMAVLSPDIAAMFPDSESVNEEFDYTQWRQTLLAALSGEEISRQAMEFQRHKQRTVALAEDKAEYQV